MESQSITLTRDVSYAVRRAPDSKGLILLLHGYLQSGSDIFNLLDPYLPSDWTILAPNGIFPLAHRHKAKAHLVYTWYLFDPTTNRYLIDMKAACQYLQEFIKSHQHQGTPLKIVGYSQGGYLAPVAAQSLPLVESVIGINCRFREEVLKHPLPFSLHGIHGLDDILVNPERARECHQVLRERGTQGRFIGVEKAGHRMNQDLGEALKQALI